MTDNEIKTMLEENSALNKLQNEKIDLLAYEPNSHLSEIAGIQWPVSEISSLERQKGATSRKHVRAVIQ